MSTIPNDPNMNQSPGNGEPLHRSTTDRVADRAHRAIDSAAETVNEAEREIRRSAGHAAHRVRSSEAELASTVDENVEKVKLYIENNPLASAGIAFVAGLVISSLLRR